ncbi:unnamed protein product [Meloidogyne enterolobii]|uniref:Uncharacterized protein n=1 Tax=Meloidogyne enterolobii TaxID=390850 RepID=A0ACB0Y1Z4_MELEN
MPSAASIIPVFTSASNKTTRRRRILNKPDFIDDSTKGKAKKTKKKKQKQKAKNNSTMDEQLLNEVTINDVEQDDPQTGELESGADHVEIGPDPVEASVNEEEMPPRISVDSTGGNACLNNEGTEDGSENLLDLQVNEPSNSQADQSEEMNCLVAEKLIEKQSGVNKLIEPVLNFDSSMDLQLSNKENIGYSTQSVSCGASIDVNVPTEEVLPVIAEVNIVSGGGDCLDLKLGDKGNIPSTSEENSRPFGTSGGSDDTSDGKPPRKVLKEKLDIYDASFSKLSGEEVKSDCTSQQLSEVLNVFTNSYFKLVKKKEKLKLLRRDDVTGQPFEELVEIDEDYFFKKIRDLIVTKVKLSKKGKKPRLVYMSSEMYIKRAIKFLEGEERRDESFASEAIWGAFAIEVALFYKDFDILIVGHSSLQTLALFAAEFHYKDFSPNFFRSIIDNLNHCHKNFYSGNEETRTVYNYLLYVQDFCKYFKKIDKAVFKEELVKFLPTNKEPKEIDNIFIYKWSQYSKIGGHGPHHFKYEATDRKRKDKNIQQSKGVDGEGCSTSMTTGSGQGGGRGLTGSGNKEDKWFYNKGGNKGWNNRGGSRGIKKGGGR